LSKYYGLLSGVAFSLSYSISGIFYGMAIDKYNRSKILSLACIGWSLTSLITGRVNSLAVLAVMRFALGFT
jgi:MFS family permease